MIEDTGMSIMISGPRIDIITSKIEIGQYKKKKYIDGTQWSAVPHNRLQIEYALMSFMIGSAFQQPIEARSTKIGFKLSML